MSSLPDLHDIVEQFPRSRGVQRVPLEQIDGLRDCLQGEAILNDSGPWWARIWKPDQWRAWKMWAFRRSRLQVVITVLHEGDRDPELESIVRLLLRCMELPDQPADPPEAFAERVLALGRKKFPLLKFELAEGFQLKIETTILNLANFYRAYIRQPDRIEQILLPAMTTAVQIQGWGDHVTTPPLEQVRDRVMPMLYSEQAWRERFADILGEPWIAGLVILYVVDESNAYWYIREELLKEWGLTPAGLHEIALDNLNSYFEREPMEMTVATTEEGQFSMMMPGKPDTYHSTRLLCHSFLEKMRDVANGDLIVGVPGRDFFVATSPRLPQMVERLRNQVSEDYQRMDHPLTDRMLLITADGVSEVVNDDAR